MRRICIWGSLPSFSAHRARSRNCTHPSSSSSAPFPADTPQQISSSSLIVFRQTVEGLSRVRRRSSGGRGPRGVTRRLVTVRSLSTAHGVPYASSVPHALYHALAQYQNTLYHTLAQYCTRWTVRSLSTAHLHLRQYRTRCIVRELSTAHAGPYASSVPHALYHALAQYHTRCTIRQLSTTHAGPCARSVPHTRAVEPVTHTLDHMLAQDRTL
eukprot:1957444-Rhodomonas_salina.2